MKFSFKFSNLLGSVYKKGNLLFTPDGNSLMSPVGNRVTIFDLKNNKSATLPLESLYNITVTALSPNGHLLIAFNECGVAHLISLLSQSVVCTHQFPLEVSCAEFSPNGQYVAIGMGRMIHIYKSPALTLTEMNPFVLVKIFKGSVDDVTCLDWADDSNVVAFGGKEGVCRIGPVRRVANFRSISLSGHADVITGVYFERGSLDVISLSANGRLFLWEANIELSDIAENTGSKVKKRRKSEGDDIDLTRGELKDKALEEEEQDSEEEEDTVDAKVTETPLRYKLIRKNYIADDHHKRVTSAAYHKLSKILVVGVEDGNFFLYEMPDVNLIHTLKISTSSISAFTFNPSGDWLAMGCENLGQLLVWEWQSETYILKQQGHSYGVSTLSYSSDGQYIVTGGDDGKVKLWNTLTGYCFVTFSEHSSGVSCVKFASNRKFILSASLDGTVRTYDMVRYRNFRTLTSTRPVQFVSCAIDSSCEFVAAGGQDVFEIYLWSLKVGRLLEVLSGHEGPVVGLDFHPGLTSTQLASVSWDKTLRLWNAIESSTSYESVQLTADGLAVAFRPDGKEVATVSLDAQISLFDPANGQQVGFIEGKNDLKGGKSDVDLITAKKSQQGKSFTCLSYSADGKFIIAGGQSKYVCIYNRAEEIIVKRYAVTQNRSLDAVDDFINRRKMTEFGNMNLIEMREDNKSDMIRLPGSKKLDMASRSFKPEVRIYSLQFSPTNQAWAAATTEGILIFSLDSGVLFDPFLLEESVTPDSIQCAKDNKRFSDAIMMALRLNEKDIIRDIVESVPSEEIEVCSTVLPEIYVEKLLDYISKALESSKHIEFYLLWTVALLPKIKNPPLSILLSLQKSLTKKYQDIAKIADFNKFTIQLIQNLAIKNKAPDDELMECEEGLHM